MFPVWENGHLMITLTGGEIDEQINHPPKGSHVFQMESLVMRKPVEKIPKKLWRTDPCVFKDVAVFIRDRAPAGHLDGKANRQTDRSPPDGSQFLNGEPAMRNRLQVSFWGLHLDADGIIAIAAALLIVLVFALLLALRF
jgi:hypothetical protein